MTSLLQEPIECPKCQHSFTLEHVLGEDLLKKQREESAHLQKLEMTMRQKIRDFELKEREQEITIQRKIDEQRLTWQKGLQDILQQEYQLKMQEKDKAITDMKKQIDELKHRSEITSQQLQGEVLELEIEKVLAHTFPEDLITPVAKGQRGGDIIHTVKTLQGTIAGTIVWETKRTKNWNEAWIEKIKTDQKESKAECAVIYSDVLPKDTKGNLILRDGVWVCDHNSFHGLATALRTQLITIQRTKVFNEHQDQKMAFLYQYLTSTAFKQKIETLVEVFKQQRDDLEKEKRMILKQWSSREQQIQRLMQSTVGLYGDVQGIIGGQQLLIADLEE
jgi:hypothetical protein